MYILGYVFSLFLLSRSSKHPPAIMMLPYSAEIAPLIRAACDLAKGIYPVWYTLDDYQSDFVDLETDFPDLSSRQGFGRQSNRVNGTGNGNSQRATSSSGLSPSSSSQALHQNASFSSNMLPDEMQQALDPEPTKFFFQEQYARLGVKGNFLPLAAQPPNVDLGEWLAHHCK